MRKQYFASILFVLLISVSFFAQKKVSYSTNSENPKNRIERLEKNIPVLMEKASVPGMSVALIQDGKLVFNGSFGVMNSENKTTVSPETVFEAASLTKPVVAYAVLKLVDQGKFDLDIPLNKYLGNNYDVGDDKRLDKITARRVLSHSGGFPNWRRPRRSKVLKINFTPGEKFSYSGEGFVYLSRVIEKLTDMKFEDFVKKTVFDPLKMKSSSLVWEDRFENLKVYNHNALGGTAGRRKGKKANAAASLLTTSEDYSKFIIALLKGKGLKKKTQKAMFSTQIEVNKEKAPNLFWGLGVGLQENKNGRSFWHWGDNGNNKSFFLASVDQKNAIIFFTNSANGLSFLNEMLSIGLGGEHPSATWLDYGRFDSPTATLLKAIAEQGAEKALKAFNKKRQKDADLIITERQMNRLGYNLIYLKKYPEAMAVFEQNAKDFPESANVWDSLAEGCMLNGKKDLAIKYYEKSLQLDPNNKNAIKKLKELKAK